jgi:hypothetical protein
MQTQLEREQIGEVLRMAKKTQKDSRLILGESQLGHSRWRKVWAILREAGAMSGLAALALSTLILLGGYFSRDFDLRVDARIDTKAQPINSKLDLLSERLSTLEGEIKVLLAQRSITASAEYSMQGKAALAVKSVQQAERILTSASSKKLQAPPEYFKSTVDVINSTLRVVSSREVKEKLQEVRASLATYRSSLQPMPSLPPEMMELNPIPPVLTPNMIGGRAVYRITRGLAVPPHTKLISEGAVINGAEIPPGSDRLQPSSRAISRNNNVVSGLILLGASQTLDGIVWRNVTFVNERITYLGGEVVLDHVKFVNCTFNIPQSQKGSKFADYATLLEETFSSS